MPVENYNDQEQFQKISNEYINIIKQLIDISIEYSNVLVDNIFNIKFSLSILKGGIFDFQRGNNLSDINNEVKNIKDNLSNSSRLVRITKTKANSFKELKSVKFIYKDELHSKMVSEFAHSIERFLTVFNNRVLNSEYDLMNKLENKGLNKISKEEVDKWHNLFFSINNTGFNMIKSNKKNAKKMKEHLDLYQKMRHDRSKINEILEEMSISEIIDEEFNKVDISFLRAGMVISKDIYNDNGIKIKSAYEMITDKDIENFYDKGIKDIFLENPLHSELHPENFRIALIDIISDDKVSLREWLESLGFIITRYDEPRKALGELIREDFADLLILDVDMPDIDGLTFLENLRTSTFGKKLPVIIIAKISDLESVKRAISLKAFHYIKKPINKELVIKKIAQILSLSTLLNPKDKNEDSNDTNS